jgi:hypothetical protein
MSKFQWAAEIEPQIQASRKRKLGALRQLVR